jgi:hypothetical protein
MKQGLRMGMELLGPALRPETVDPSNLSAHVDHLVAAAQGSLDPGEVERFLEETRPTPGEFLRIHDCMAEEGSTILSIEQFKAEMRELLSAE